MCQRLRCKVSPVSLGYASSAERFGIVFAGVSMGVGGSAWVGVEGAPLCTLAHHLESYALLSFFPSSTYLLSPFRDIPTNP